jgi:fatty-acyl-CoA synthase
MLYGDWIGRRAKSAGTTLALVDVPQNRRFTYAELGSAVNRMAQFFSRELGVGKGDRVAVLAFNRAEVITAFFAAGRLGAILVPLNYRLTPGELVYYIEDAKPKALLFDREHRTVVADLQQRTAVAQPVCLDHDECGDSLASVWPVLGDKEPPPIDIGAEDPALIIYTSGTTGVPKGVVLTHGMITWNAINTHGGWDLGRTDSTILHSALFYTAGWNVFTLPLFYCCGTNVLVRGFEADLVLRLMADERITLFFGVPTMFQMLLESALFDATPLSSVRFMVSGGAPLPAKVFKAYQTRKNIHLREGYGLTEAGPNNFLANGKLGTVGHPMFNVDVKLMGPDGREAPAGQDGELYLRGNHICAGYWNKPAETAAAFDRGWFRTGDLARIDGDGHLAIVGRLKDMFISGGINVYPAEIERAIEAHPRVEAAAVIGVPDDKWGEVGKAIVQLKAEQALDLNALRGFLRERLAGFKIPKYLVVVPELPRTAASGKVQKFLLKNDHGAADNR